MNLILLRLAYVKILGRCYRLAIDVSLSLSSVLRLLPISFAMKDRNVIAFLSVNAISLVKFNKISDSFTKP